jgi:DNA-binding YbaB/EbfC family protein
MNNMMGQVKKLQKELEKKLEEFYEKEFEYDYKNGSVIINILGSGKIVGIKINKVLIDPDDQNTLEEMTCEAVNYEISGVNDDKNAIERSIMPQGMPGGLF